MTRIQRDAAALLARCCVGQAGDGSPCTHSGGGQPTHVIRDPGRVPADGALGPEIQLELARITGQTLRRGHAIRVLVDGSDSFGAMLDLVRMAATEILFENFIFRSDAIGRTFARELRARAEDALSVHVVHDPAGAVMARRPPIDLAFRGSTVDVRWFNLALPSRSVRRLGRDHRKLVIADRARMVVGGICLADPWVGNCVRHCTWRDSALLVHAPAAAAAGTAFDHVRSRSRRLLPGAPGGSSDPAGPPGHPSEDTPGDIPVRLVADLGPLRATERVLVRVFAAAKREILVTNPYFIPPDGVLDALVRAVRRGVNVHVLVPGRNNHVLAGLSVEERIGPLLEAGGHVHRWNGPMIHAKSVVVDREWTLVGSSNLDNLSLRRNAELNVEVHGTAVAQAMATLFWEDCRQSTVITNVGWQTRPRKRRIATRTAVLLRRWQ